LNFKQIRDWPFIKVANRGFVLDGTLINKKQVQKQLNNFERSDKILICCF